MQQTNECGWDVQTLHMNAFVAYFFLHCLRKVDYFGTSSGEDQGLTRDEIFMVEILMQLMNASSTNSSEMGIFNAGQTSATLLEGDIRPIGCSLQPAVALLNHSCDPNTIRFVRFLH